MAAPIIGGNVSDRGRSTPSSPQVQPPDAITPVDGAESVPATAPDATVRVLVLEPDAHSSAILSAQLRDAGIVVTSTSNRRDAECALTAQIPDLIVVAIEGAGVGGADLLAEWRANPHIARPPALLLTSTSGCAWAFSLGIDLGAVDVVRKPAETNELVARVRLAVRSSRRTLELRSQTARLQERNVELERVAVRDPLTAAFNRRYLEQRMRAEIDRSRRYGLALSVIIADIDHFKSINDRYGHAAGDAILRGVSKLVQTTIRQCDLLARYGGEEFVVLTPNTNLARAQCLAERIRVRISATAMLATSGSGTHASIPVSASFGVATYVPNASGQFEPASVLLEAADEALYRAKREGRNRVRVSETSRLEDGTHR